MCRTLTELRRVDRQLSRAATRLCSQIYMFFSVCNILLSSQTICFLYYCYVRREKMWKSCCWASELTLSMSFLLVEMYYISSAWLWLPVGISQCCCNHYTHSNPDDSRWDEEQKTERKRDMKKCSNIPNLLLIMLHQCNIKIVSSRSNIYFDVVIFRSRLVEERERRENSDSSERLGRVKKIHTNVAIARAYIISEEIAAWSRGRENVRIWNIFERETHTLAREQALGSTKNFCWFRFTKWSSFGGKCWRERTHKWSYLKEKKVIFLFFFS